MAENASSPQNRIIPFIRTRDYQLVEELGEGACGKTVLLYDDLIDEHFVCKKYSPHSENHRQELFTNFIREIKLLHRLQHANVVRVFNYYLYPDSFRGYILMEFVDGSDVDDYIKNNPEKTSELFLQAISGFNYLEKQGVLHRDIRPQNLMVTSDGTLKIIDLGFGKHVADSKDYQKSISLNWWCEIPADFNDGRYDFTTEVYFVGKLFERLIRDNEIEHFHYTGVLRQMCEHNPDQRIQSFAAIAQNVRNDQFQEISFGRSVINSYRIFAYHLFEQVIKVEHGSKYVDDFARIERDLNDAYRRFMLEETIPDCAAITSIFISGTYTYIKAGFPVSAVKNFLESLKSCTEEQKRIILANLHSRLDAVERESPPQKNDFDIPF